MKWEGLAIVLAATVGLGACAQRDFKGWTTDGPTAGRDLDLLPKSPFGIIRGETISASDDFARSIAGVYNLEEKTLCTGSIISTNIVLTAAHCVPRNPKNLRIFFGPSMESLISIHRVTDVLLSPAYGERLQKLADWGDVALVKFSGSMPESFKSVTLVNESRELQPGEFTLIAGYGVDNGLNGEGSGLLRKTIVPIEDPQFSRFEALLNQTNGTGACHGDSGGPAFISTTEGLQLWGITSRSHKDPYDDCSHFSIYSKVSAYQEWITEAHKSLTMKSDTQPLIIAAAEPTTAMGD